LFLADIQFLRAGNITVRAGLVLTAALGATVLATVAIPAPARFLASTVSGLAFALLIFFRAHLQFPPFSPSSFVD
jgi:hypothetical protein